MIAQVVPLRRMPPHLAWLDYLVPDELKNKISVGQLIKIPFRSSLEFGIVRTILTKVKVDTVKLKSVDSVALERPLLSLAQLKFLEEMAELYAAPLGFLVKSNLLPLKKRKITAIKEQGIRSKEQIEQKQNKPQLAIYKNLDEKKEYLQQSISRNGQNLILVPELHDIENTLNLLTPEQRTRAMVITSEMGEKNLFDRWLEIWQKPDVIVAGTRRALFLPFFNLQTIIMDDEANPAHKSWDMAPRFHTRDAAMFLSHHHHATLYLITPTPSIETYYFANKNVYENAEVNPRPSPSKDYTIVNMRDERRGGNYNILSDEVADRVKNNSNGITFLYLNRRGNLHYIACRDCGNVSKCPNCNSSLTYYESKGQLRCLRCGYGEPLSMTCKKCGGTSSLTYGAGTQQLCKEVKKLVGTSRNIVRVDSDDEKNILLPDTPGTIIVGTQYAWGRIPWVKINLCVFVDADTPLFVPEYKSSEELWHQLHDAKFRLESNGQLFVQTSHQEHLIFQSLQTPEQFYEAELKTRKLFGYPPFNFLVKFFVGFPSELVAKNEVTKFQRTLAQLTKNSTAATISSPIPSFPPYAKGKFWYVILAKVSYSEYKKWTKLLVSRMPMGWKVDPNPNSILGI